MEGGMATEHDKEFKPQEDSGLTALQQAYNNPEVSLSSLIMGAVIVAALAGILVTLVLFGGN
jgi:hypothetical protein